MGKEGEARVVKISLKDRISDKLLCHCLRAGTLYE